MAAVTDGRLGAIVSPESLPRLFLRHRDAEYLFGDGRPGENCRATFALLKSIAGASQPPALPISSAMPWIKATSLCAVRRRLRVKLVAEGGREETRQPASLARDRRRP